MALAEFSEFMADKEDDDDEDNDPREDVLGRFVSQKQIEAVAAALPPGSRTLAATGNIAKRINSLVITAKANAGPDWMEVLHALIKRNVPRRPDSIVGFPPGTTAAEAADVQRAMEDSGLGRFFEGYTCICNEQAITDKPSCPVCAASGLPCGAGSVKWLVSPDTAKIEMIAQFLRWTRAGSVAGTNPKVKMPTHGCNVNSINCGLPSGCDACAQVRSCG